ncbi:Fe(2+) transporter permease subunit FeoB [Sediminispirochaeta bajacaliforniensis]|uniref:Fe(2+) transporter permease subunit FeoB n=1 Tax=Sediminispirochaeta bajacaliforniensis TaxID=148 RepID=UPI00037D4B7F|nr:Fe(2+) transporter permease subunit FeoB [Sediminispirochaeta bajacaliforniensis]
MKRVEGGASVTDFTIALAGNPNCGKTTLFNALTGGNQRIGNWPGVTVEKKEGWLSGSRRKKVVDLPGIYSLNAGSEDEKAARDYLLSGDADLVVNIVDASHLERNLYLTTTILEMGVPVVLFLNMMDLLEKEGSTIDIKELESSLGVPVVAGTATNKKSVAEAVERIAELVGKVHPSKHKPTYPNEVEALISKWEERAGGRWNALALYEGTAPSEIHGLIPEKEILAEREKISSLLKEDAEVILADGRYGFVRGVVTDVFRAQESRRSISERIDNVVLNRFLGIPIFLVVMYLMFWLAISVGSAFIDFFDVLFGTVFVDGFGVLLENIGAPAWVVGFLAGGVGVGIQTVATFVPVVFFMFLALSLLEDSGYMARAAFVMDRLMRALGLPGKAFVPMIVGFGCTVPAILATRTLENKRDRFMTIFMAPFMSCGARLPVYALFGAALFGARAGGIVFSIYIVGVVLAILTGLFLKHSLFRGEPGYFIMELPPYHAPRFKHVMLHTWTRLKVFIARAGKVIVLAVFLLGVLNSLGTDGSFGNEDTENSVLAVTGKAITPVFSPMGIESDNWPATVGLFTGLFAKEAVVGTLNGLYGQMAASENAAIDAAGEEEEPFNLWAGIGESFGALKDGVLGISGGIGSIVGADVISGGDEEAVAEAEEVDISIFALMRRNFTSVSGYAYLLFVLVYFPCLAAFGAAVKEMGIGFGALHGLYLTLTAWAVAVLYYQIAEGGSLLWMIVSAAIMVAQFFMFRVIGNRNRKKAALQSA